jgi:hypothetical protein
VVRVARARLGPTGAHLRFAAAPVSDSRGDETEPADEKERSAASWRISWRCGSIGFGTAIRRAPTAIRSLCRSASRTGSRPPRSNCAAPLSRRIRARSRWSGGARRPAGANGPTSAAARCFPSFTPRTSFSSIPTCRCSRRNTSASALSNASPSPCRRRRDRRCRG